MAEKQDLGLGKLIKGEAFRDAIHVAVCPMLAADSPLEPGQRIGVKDGEAVFDYRTGKALGIVDPYLEKPVLRGQRFWMFLFPNTITGLRHEWEHPALPKPEDILTGMADETKKKAEAWLRSYAERVNNYLSPDDAFRTLITDIGRKGITYHGTDMHGIQDLEDREQLQKYASVYLGYEVNFDEFEHFSCSC